VWVFKYLKYIFARLFSKKLNLQNFSLHKKCFHYYIVVVWLLIYVNEMVRMLVFHSGCLVVNGKKGIHYVYGDDGRVNGDCFVELESKEDVKLALVKHRNNLGRRYVEGGVNWSHTFLFFICSKFIVRHGFENGLVWFVIFDIVSFMHDFSDNCIVLFVLFVN